MSWKAIEAHAKKYSQSVQKGYKSPWTTDPESMAKKTVLKKVLKYAPKAVEQAELIAEAVNGDSAIINTNIIKDGNDFTYTQNFDYSPESTASHEVPAEPEKTESEQRANDQPVRDSGQTGNEGVNQSLDSQFGENEDIPDGLF